MAGKQYALPCPISLLLLVFFCFLLYVQVIAKSKA